MVEGPDVCTVFGESDAGAIVGGVGVYIVWGARDPVVEGPAVCTVWGPDVCTVWGARDPVAEGPDVCTVFGESDAGAIVGGVGVYINWGARDPVVEGPDVCMVWGAREPVDPLCGDTVSETAVGGANDGGASVPVTTGHSNAKRSDARTMMYIVYVCMYRTICRELCGVV